MSETRIIRGRRVVFERDERYGITDD